nr:nitrous oxide reductase accessory protein NosL [Desulfobulbaceae bacterium]
MRVRSSLIYYCISIVILCLPKLSTANSLESEVQSDTRCTVCGMFVAKYPAWISKIAHKNGDHEYFDGVKDMLVYYFDPLKFGSTKENPVTKMIVKDYYSLEAIDAKTAFYVLGSDVYGPMGHEFIPFSSLEAAEAFKKDHHGQEIVTFGEITSKRVESMRSGHTMK